MALIHFIHPFCSVNQRIYGKLLHTFVPRLLKSPVQAAFFGVISIVPTKVHESEHLSSYLIFRSPVCFWLANVVRIWCFYQFYFFYLVFRPTGKWVLVLIHFFPLINFSSFLQKVITEDSKCLWCNKWTNWSPAVCKLLNFYRHKNVKQLGGKAAKTVKNTHAESYTVFAWIEYLY